MRAKRRVNLTWTPARRSRRRRVLVHRQLRQTSIKLEMAARGVEPSAYVRRERHVTAWSARLGREPAAPLRSATCRREYLITSDASSSSSPSRRRAFGVTLVEQQSGRDSRIDRHRRWRTTAVRDDQHQDRPPFTEDPRPARTATRLDRDWRFFVGGIQSPRCCASSVFQTAGR